MQLQAIYPFRIEATILRLVKWLGIIWIKQIRFPAGPLGILLFCIIYAISLGHNQAPGALFLKVPVSCKSSWFDTLFFLPFSVENFGKVLSNSNLQILNKRKSEHNILKELKWNVNNMWSMFIFWRYQASNFTLHNVQTERRTSWHVTITSVLLYLKRSLC
jgi:hypothetical protein